MKSVYPSCLIILSTTVFLSCSHISIFSKKDSRQVLPKFPELEIVDTYFDVNVDFNNRTLHCSNIYRFVNPNMHSMPTIFLYSGHPMLFKEININNQSVDYETLKYLWEGREITLIEIPLFEPIDNSDTIIASIKYTVTYPEDYPLIRKAARIDSNSIYVTGGAQWYVRWKPSVYDMSTLYTLRVTVPEDQLVLSPGKLIDRTEYEKTVSFTFRQEKSSTPFFASRKYRIVEKTIDDIVMEAYLPKDGDFYPDFLMQSVAQSISFYNNQLDLDISIPMQLIRCTGKLQKEMGLKKADLLKAEPHFSCLGSWHANLLHIDRRKCILFVNDKTLFNFIAPNVSRAEIRNLSVLFKSYLKCVLADEGVVASAREKILSEYVEIGYAKTNSKSVLGSMNDLAFHYKYHIQEEGGVHSYAVPSIIRKLNHMPMGAIEYTYPIEALKAIYEIET